MDKTLLILAAGMGSRCGRLKQLDPVGPSGEVMPESSGTRARVSAPTPQVRLVH